MDIKAIGKIRHNGESYSPGDILTDLTKKEGERLINLKVGEFMASEEGMGALDLPISDDLATIEDFTKLKADEQKELLETLEIEPSTKAEDRIKQYSEWFELQVNVDEDNL
ncbi:hypothetical protein [Paenibacillus crassostreae]|uniref:DUF7210 domain-containing protein n=1 Tax=Paenibacillus crassostreae TaxID=1763538 RepID=A0A162KRL2_9BACL|nr:hypothetical protein [Paenibacillus crassostreae]OAB72793.1 hypothetical protein PNBC_15275 [Paenibacillus crassostreae]